MASAAADQIQRFAELCNATSASTSATGRGAANFFTWLAGPQPEPRNLSPDSLRDVRELLRTRTAARLTDMFNLAGQACSARALLLWQQERVLIGKIRAEAHSFCNRHMRGALEDEFGSDVQFLEIDDLPSAPRAVPAAQETPRGSAASTARGADPPGPLVAGDPPMAVGMTAFGRVLK